MEAEFHFRHENETRLGSFGNLCFAQACARHRPKPAKVRFSRLNRWGALRTKHRCLHIHFRHKAETHPASAAGQPLLNERDRDRNCHRDSHDPGDNELGLAAHELGTKHRGVRGCQQKGDVAQDVDRPPVLAGEPAQCRGQQSHPMRYSAGGLPQRRNADRESNLGIRTLALVPRITP
jgi:hypothetical protein